MLGSGECCVLPDGGAIRLTAYNFLPGQENTPHGPAMIRTGVIRFQLVPWTIVTSLGPPLLNVCPYDANLCEDFVPLACIEPSTTIL